MGRHSKTQNLLTSHHGTLISALFLLDSLIPIKNFTKTVLKIQ
jgi:hypothetical protein